MNKSKNVTVLPILILLLLPLTACQETLLKADLRCENEVIQVKASKDKWRELDNCNDPPDGGNVCCVVRRVLACLPAEVCPLTYVELIADGGPR